MFRTALRPVSLADPQRLVRRLSRSTMTQTATAVVPAHLGTRPGRAAPGRRGRSAQDAVAGGSVAWIDRGLPGRQPGPTSVRGGLPTTSSHRVGADDLARLKVHHDGEHIGELEGPGPDDRR